MSFNTDRSKPGVRWVGLGLTGVDTSFIEPRHLARVERFGYVFAALHARLLARADKEVGVCIADFWRDMEICNIDDAINTFYPTMMDLLGISTAKTDQSVATSSAAISGVDFGRVESRKLNYQHFAGFENEAGVR